MTDLAIRLPTGDEADLEVSPDRGGARELASRHRRAPLVHTYVADCETPVSAFLKLRDGGPAFLLESVEEAQQVGRYSIVGVNPEAVVRVRGEEVAVSRPGALEEVSNEDPFLAVQRLVDEMGVAPPEEDVFFWGGAVGFFGYDLVRRVERLPNVPEDDLGIDDLTVVLTGPVVVFDHLRRTLTLVALCNLEAEDLDAAYDDTVQQIRELRALLDGPIPAARPRRPGPAAGEVTSNVSRERFERGVETCREYIFAGDAFQVVPSQRFSAPIALEPFSVYRGLRTVNPSPYMFYLEFGDVALVGGSPETMVKVQDRSVEMNPIAGTRWRGADPSEDEALARELLDDPKERAEHVMLVDLGRNDLGRVCEVGSVHVSELMRVRHYSHVMHIESTVRGTLAAGRSPVEALRAAFPAGTLSGAPKVRAMEIIDELETTKRGPYGGAVGYVGYSGNLDTCITIRTIVCSEGVAHVQAGAGVVADSVPAREYDETQNKAAALFRAIEVAARQPGW
jgi:anthranilate synthase component 1